MTTTCPVCNQTRANALDYYTTPIPGSRYNLYPCKRADCRHAARTEPGRYAATKEVKLGRNDHAAR